MLYFDARDLIPGKPREEENEFEISRLILDPILEPPVSSLYTYCSPNWSKFWSDYDSVHDYISLILVTIGVLTNLLNLWVFTRKKNRQSPVKTVLLVLAVSDLFFMVTGLVRGSLLLYRGQKRKVNIGCGGGDDRMIPYQMIVEQLIYEFSYYLFHLYSIYLTVLLAVLRFLGILYPIQSRRWYTERRIRWAIFVTILFSTLLTPLMFSQVRIIRVTPGGEMNGQNTNPILYDRVTSTVGLKLMYWVYGVFGKLIPCVILTFTIFGIIFSLMKSNRDRKKMQNATTTTNISTISKLNIMDENQKTDKNGEDNNSVNTLSLTWYEFDRTTRMLLVILLFFFMTESPDGIISLVYILSNSNAVRKGCLAPIINFLLLLDYLSSVSSFFIYFTMSHTFRSTLIQSFSFFYSSPTKFKRFR